MKLDLELLLAVLGIILPLIATMIGATWKISQWCKEINMRLAAILERLSEGQARFEKIEDTCRDHEHRITVLENQR